MKIMNCPICYAVVARKPGQELCETCHSEEENEYEKVYSYLRKRKNRKAVPKKISEETGVSEKLIYKWAKRRRINSTLFSGVSYPCNRCDNAIKRGILCEGCTLYINISVNNLGKDQI